MSEQNQNHHFKEMTVHDQEQLTTEIQSLILDMGEITDIEQSFPEDGELSSDFFKDRWAQMRSGYKAASSFVNKLKSHVSQKYGVSAEGYNLGALETVRARLGAPALWRNQMLNPNQEKISWSDSRYVQKVINRRTSGELSTMDKVNFVAYELTTFPILRCIGAEAIKISTRHAKSEVGKNINVKMTDWIDKFERTEHNPVIKKKRKDSKTRVNHLAGMDW